MEKNSFALLLATSCLVFFFNLGGPCLWDEDEPRNAGCAAEMIERGDWVTPYFNGEVRTHKPVLLYWLMMTAYGLLGVSEFSARSVSALLSVFTVLLTYDIGRRLFSQKVGLFAGGILTTTLMFTVAARAATPDATLIFLVTAALAIYVAYAPGLHAKTNSHSGTAFFPTDWRAILAMYAVMGLAMLAKGPVGFVLPTAVIGMFLLIVRRAKPKEGTSSPSWRGVQATLNPVHFLRTVLFMRPALLILAVLAVALPWYILVTIRSEGVWTRGFFLEHNLGRAVGSMENHSGGPWFYIVALMLGFFPWSIFFIPFLLDLVRSLRQESDERPAKVFAVCWVCVIVGLFTVASTKLPSYVTPCYPGLALLMGCFIDRLVSGRAKVARFWPIVSYSVMGVAGVGIAAALLLVAGKYVEGVEPLAAVGLVLIVGAFGSAWYWRKRQSARMVQSMFASSALFVLLLFGWAADRVGQQQEIERLTSLINERSKDPTIANWGMMRSSWVFYAGCPIRTLPERKLETAASFLAKSSDRYLLITDEEFEAAGGRLPSDTEILGSIPLFLESKRLMVIGATDDRVANARHRIR